MSDFRHHVILVTAMARQRIRDAHAEAVRLTLPVSPIFESANDFFSFCVFPDGGKINGTIHLSAAVLRAHFKDYLGEESRLPYVDWVEVCYGAHNEGALILDGHETRLNSGDQF